MRSSTEFFAACMCAVTLFAGLTLSAAGQQPASSGQAPAQSAPAAQTPQAGGQQAPRPGPPSQFADPADLPPLLRNYRAVTRQRLVKPEEENWLVVRRTYDGWGYSPLAQITPGNVSRLKLVWSAETGEVGAHQAAPLVNNGVMFISTPYNQVAAYDAKTGKLLWRYKRQRPPDAFVRHPSNRGLAIYNDKVYYGIGEAIVVALDAKTGREVWAKEVFNNKVMYYITLAPLVADGKILIGASGGDWGVRGYVAALDPETGNEIWRTYMIPAPGEPGHETWPKGGEQWKTGGAAVWVTGNYDPETNTTFWGTSNGGPWMGDQRPGDNLYIASTVALDASTGKIKGHMQYTPNESFDWDEVSPPILVDFRRGGRTIKGAINVARNGYLYFLDRTGGSLRFVDGKPYVNQNVFRSLDPKTGRPDIDPEHKPGTDKTATYCPSLSGGKNWPPIAYSPRTRMIYIPANNNLCQTMTGIPITYSTGKSFSGVKAGGVTLREGATHVGEVQAWNVDTGEKVWTHTYRQTNWGPMLTTGGGLVFSGGTPDRQFHAFDATSGKLLWEHETSSGVLGQPVSFAVDGKQYIAVLTGWDADARGSGSNVARLLGEPIPNVPRGGAIYVFAVE
ncbi:MAG: PQQ-dependent dehydrogenase, methanol/ethanol family [Candidatus Korobacteraceae bacterium]